MPLVLVLAGCGDGRKGTGKDPGLTLSAPTSQLAVNHNGSLAVTTKNVTEDLIMASSTPDICSVTFSGKLTTANQPTVQAMAVGNCSIKATQIADEEWNAGSQSVTFSILASAVTPTFTFIYSAAAGGSINIPCTNVTADAATAQCNSNATYFTGGNTVTAIPKTGYEFVKWSDNNSTNPIRTDNGANVNATATFQKKMITITYVSGLFSDIYQLSPGGSLTKCSEPCTKVVAYGDQTPPMIQYLNYSKSPSTLSKGVIVGWGYIKMGESARHFITHGRTLPIQTATEDRTYYALTNANASGPISNVYLAGANGHLQTRDPESQLLFDTQSFSFAVTSVTQVQNSLTFSLAPYAPSLTQSPPYNFRDYLYSGAAGNGSYFDSQKLAALLSLTNGFTGSALVPYLLDTTTPISITGLADASFTKAVEPSHDVEFSSSVTRIPGVAKTVGGSYDCNSSGNNVGTEQWPVGGYACTTYFPGVTQSLGGVVNGGVLYYAPYQAATSYCAHYNFWTGNCSFHAQDSRDYDSFIFSLTPSAPGTTFSIADGGNEYSLSRQGCCTFTVQPKGHASHIVTIVATAQDGKSTKAISVELSHDPQPVLASVSTFTLRVNGIDKNAGDTVVLPIGTKAVTVETSAGTRATVSGASNLVPGNNIVTVTVLSSDGRGKTIQSFIAQVGTESYFHPSSVSYASKFPTSFTVPLNPGVNFQALTQDSNGNPLNVMASTIPTPLTEITQNPGDSSEITPLADKGFVFTGWTLPDGSTSKTTPGQAQGSFCDSDHHDWSQVANDKNCGNYAENIYTAKFSEAWYNFTSSVIGHGGVSSAGTQRIRGNDDFVYWVYPDAGYHLDAEIVDGYSSPPTPGSAEKLYSLNNVTADHSFVAKFMPDKYVVHFDGNFGSQPATGLGSITPPADVQVTPGSAMTLPDKGSLNAGVDQIFIGWSRSPSGALISGSFTPDGLDADVTLYAIWSANKAPHTIASTSQVNGQLYLGNSLVTAIGGSISVNGMNSFSPGGTVSFNYGDNATYTFAPQAGYTLGGVSIDGGAPVTVDYAPGYSAAFPRFTYTFTNVIHAHTIVANWVQLFTLSASVIMDFQTPTAATQHYISTPGVTSIGFGANQTYTMDSIPGYFAGEVFVDNVSHGQITTYTFTNVTASHTIKVSYVGIPVAPVTTFCTITYVASGTGTLTGTSVQRLAVGTTGTSVTATFVGGVYPSWSDGLGTWSGSGTYTSTRSDSCTSDITITARQTT